MFAILLVIIIFAINPFFGMIAAGIVFAAWAINAVIGGTAVLIKMGLWVARK